MKFMNFFLPKYYKEPSRTALARLRPLHWENPDDYISSKTELLNKKLRNALLNDDTNEFRSILEKDGWPRYSDWSDFDLLIQAIKHDRKKIAHLLLDLRCRVFKKPNMVTPLHLAAAKQGWTDVVERLLKLKLRVANQINIGRGNGNTALHYAFFERFLDLEHTIDLLLTTHLKQRRAGGRHVNIKNKDELSFLHIACTRPNLDVVKALFEVDEDVIYSQELVSLRTPLHLAVEYGRHKIAEFLLQSGADVYKQDDHESTPLHLALKRADAKMIDLLLAHDKRRINIVNLYGVSHLMVACAGSNVDIAKEYLEIGKSTVSSINAKVQKTLGQLKGCSAIHFAADFGRADTVELLLDRGANCCSATPSGHTAHYLARKQGYTRVCQMLDDHCDIVKKCKRTRAESPDFGAWGEKYEKNALDERIKTLKCLNSSLKKFKSLT